MRKMTSLYSQVGNIRERIEKLMKETEPQDRKGSKKPASKKSNKMTGHRSKRLGAIGKTFVYHGGKVKVVERKNGRYFVKAVTNIAKGKKTIKKGKKFPVGNPWIHKNMAA
jgi:hypothetical protein